MKGAIADPLVRMMRAANKSSIMTMGKSQYFFLCLKNPHKSFRNSTINDSFLIGFFNILACKRTISYLHHGVGPNFESPEPKRVLPENPP